METPAPYAQRQVFSLPDFVPLNSPQAVESHSLEEDVVAEAHAESIAGPPVELPGVAAESGEELAPPPAMDDGEPAPAEALEQFASWPQFESFGEPSSQQEPELEALSEEELSAPVFEPEEDIVPAVAESAEDQPPAAIEQPLLAVEEEPQAIAEPEPLVVEEPLALVEVFAEPVLDVVHTGALSAAKAGRATSPLAEKVVDALIKTVTEAVYAKPSASERAAFLREIAELVERGEAEAPAPVDVAPPPPDPGLAALEAPAPAAIAVEADEINEVIAGRLGPASQILRKYQEHDPFAPVSKAETGAKQIEETAEADEDSGELAISLLDMMAGGSASSQPQERALAADTLLRIVPRIPAKQLLAISERVSIMEQPPSLLVAKLIRDQRHEIAAPLLERCMHITDQDLATATAEGDVYKLRMIARRRIISPTLSDQLIGRSDSSVILTLVRNPGATFNHEFFFRLAEHAIEHPAILAPLATRADLPAPVAFELFWHVPQELRRFILSRFLTDSENLNRILKITMATQATAESGAAAEQKFPAQELLDEALVEIARGALDKGAQMLAEAAGVAAESVMRIFADREGEPIAVLLKTMGFQRSKFSDAMVALQNAEIALVRPDRKVEDIQNLFDTLSFNKARILLTYWDWYVRKAGPYAPQN